MNKQIRITIALFLAVKVVFFRAIINLTPSLFYYWYSIHRYSIECQADTHRLFFSTISLAFSHY